MNHILQIFATYVAALSFGSAFLLPFFPNRVTGKSFPRFYYGLILCFFAVFLFCLFRMQHLTWNVAPIFGLGVLLFASTFSQDFTPIQNYLYHVFGVISLLWFVIFVKNSWLAQTDFWQALPVLLAFTVSMIFLSFHLLTMIFGHWYLVNRKLPIVHLIHVCRALLIVTVLRTLVSLGSVIWVYTHAQPDVWLRLSDFYGHGIFFWGRLLAGLGVPGLVSVLAYQSAKIGSNQSATGILYAGVVFVLMGEFLALYLYALTGFFF